MTFKEYYLSLSKNARKSYAKKAGTTDHYIHTHLINRYKIPRKNLMLGLCKASNGAITIDDLTAFFFKG